MVLRSIFDHGGFIFNVIQGRGCVFSVQLSIETTLERLVLKNAAQRPNQHVKSPTGEYCFGCGRGGSGNKNWEPCEKNVSSRGRMIKLRSTFFK